MKVEAKTSFVGTTVPPPQWLTREKISCRNLKESCLYCKTYYLDTEAKSYVSSRTSVSWAVMNYGRSLSSDGLGVEVGKGRLFSGRWLGYLKEG